MIVDFQQIRRRIPVKFNRSSFSFHVVKWFTLNLPAGWQIVCEVFAPLERSKILPSLPTGFSFENAFPARPFFFAARYRFSRHVTTLQRLPILSEIVGTFLDTPTPNRETHLTLLSVWDTSEECRTMKSSVSIQSWAWYLRFQLPVRFPTEEMEREVNSLIPETCQLGTWTTLKSWDVPFE